MGREGMKTKRGLVLEGGAMRGLFTAGILDVMMEQGIEPDGLIGVSAGAAFGCNYKSRQPGRAIRYNMRFARDKRYCSMHSLLRTGNLFNAEFAYHVVPAQYDVFDGETFERNPMEYHLVCTDVRTGRAVYKKCERSGHRFFEWVRASASMPVVSRIVEIDGMQLLDGGVADSIPLEHFENIGYGRNLVILTQPEGYVKRKGLLMPLLRMALRRYPEMAEAMAARPAMYNAQTEYVRQAEREGRCMVIRPEAPLPIGHISHNPDEMYRIYATGREAGMKRMDEIKDFFSA